MKKSKIMYLMSAALLLAGCAADEQQVPVSQRVPITLNTLMVEGSLTRADNVNIQSTQFDKNQTFYAYFPENVTIGEVTSASHAVYTTDGVGNTTTAPQPYFNAGETSATVHAYYPYIAGDGGKQVTNDTESFSVEKNQHQVSGYNESDLMYATTTVEKTSPTGTLLFTHKMAKIIVNASAADNLIITDVRIVGGYRTIAIPEAGRVSCTLSTEASDLSDANSTDDYITMFTGGNNNTAVCAALLPPQELSSSNALIEIVTKDGNDGVASAKYSIAKTIESANSYTLNLSVTQASLNNTTAISNWSNNSGSTSSGQLEIVDIPNQNWTGSAIMPTISVKCNDQTLVEGIEYKLQIYDNIELGDAIVYAVGMGIYNGKLAARTFKIIKAVGSISFSETNLTKASYDDSFVNSLIKVGDGNVSFSSTNPDVATIDESTGSVNILGVGTTLIEATVDDSEHYSYENKNTYYELTVSYKMLNQAISTDARKLICSEGHIHAYNVTADAACTATRIAIIAYVGSAGSVDTSSGSQNYKGLAIAMTDCKPDNTTATWQTRSSYPYTKYLKFCSTMSSCGTPNATETFSTAFGYKNGIDITNLLLNHTSHQHDAVTAVSTYKYDSSVSAGAHPANTSVWFIPTLGQMNLILKGLASTNSNLSQTKNTVFAGSSLNSIITSVGGEGFNISDNCFYHSTSEYGYNGYWGYHAAEGYSYAANKEATSVRPVIAF